MPMFTLMRKNEEVMMFQIGSDGNIIKTGKTKKHCNPSTAKPDQYRTQNRFHTGNVQKKNRYVRKIRKRRRQALLKIVHFNK